MIRDVTERKRHEAETKRLAETDSLTGLANRNKFLLEIETRYFPQVEPGTCILLLLHVKQLAQITKVHGPSFGDELLLLIGARLRQVAGATVFLARVGDTEFGVAINAPDAQTARRSACRLSAALVAEPVKIGREKLDLIVESGTSLAADAATAEEWVGNAFFALRANDGLQQEPVAFATRMRADLLRRLELQAELAEALRDNQFELFYQPQVSLNDNVLVGAEALIRWRHPTRGLVSPAEFMPLVNSTSLSESVSQWVLETACLQGAAWNRVGHALRIGVNTAQSQFTSGSLLREVKDCLAASDFPAHLLEIEVTEDIALDKAHHAHEILTSLRKSGVKVAFDDFGTGYGSLTYLKLFPLDTIKIDQTFVRTLEAGSSDAAITLAIVELARRLDLSVIAEGIETAEVAQLLRAMGCTEGQGYYFAKPLPAHEFEEKFIVAFDRPRQLAAG